MSAPNIISFQTRLDEFYFLGIENLVTENANFGAFWDNFFDKGGYDVIDPYQTDPNCVNLLEIINANYGSQQVIRLSYQKTDSSLFFDKKPHKEDIP